MSAALDAATTPCANGACPVCCGGTLTATDFFCGAGGSSTGLENVRCPGCGRHLIVVTQALNHNPLAVEVHNGNFPHADHDVHDIQDVPPTRFRRTDLLWASPDCGHHAYCRGKRGNDEDARRSRATFNDVVRFTAYHRYDAVIVENVIEAMLWCDRRGHGDKCNCGSHFDRWRRAMERLGYRSRIVHFNSQFALPTPQSRDRMYVVFWREGLREPDLDFRPISWCSRCETVVRGVQTWKPASKSSVRALPGKFEWGRYGSQYLYTCPTCFQPVAPAVTGARTAIDFTLPMAVQVGGHLYERRPGVRVWSVDDPLRTVNCTQQMSLVVPVGGQTGQTRNPLGTDEPLGAVTTENHRALVLRYGGQQGNGRSIDEPMQTVIGSDREVGLVIPNRMHAVGASLDEPAATVTTAPAQHMLVQVNRGTKGKPGPGRNAHTLDEPLRTIAGHGELALVELQNNGSVSPVDEPARTVYGEGYHHGLLVYNGVPGFVRDLADAAGTITGRDKQSLLVPYYSTGVARPTAEPMGTVTSKDREALVFTDADVDDCYFRMLQWPELLRAQQMHVHADGRPFLMTARVKDKRGRVRDLSNEARVKFIGNAVSSPVATQIALALIPPLAEAA